MKKLVWLWKRFWGTYYRVEYTENLKENEQLYYRHILYIGKKGKRKE